GSFFGEDQGLYVVTVRDESLADFLVAADKAGLVADPIGRTIANRLIFELEEGDYCVSLEDLRTAHEGFFPALMGEDAALA
ncbi:MAG: phosphoribosylformylglycinamidine synthase II, partial [Sphingomonadales bacterium]